MIIAFWCVQLLSLVAYCEITDYFCAGPSSCPYYSDFPNSPISNWARFAPKAIKDGIMHSNLESMSIDDLWSLNQRIVSILSSKILEEVAQLEKRLVQLKDNTRRPYPPVVPKFRNPKQPSETWSGRGKRPRWLSAQLKNGKQLDDFRVHAF